MAWEKSDVGMFESGCLEWFTRIEPFQTSAMPSCVAALFIFNSSVEPNFTRLSRRVQAN